MGHDRFCVLPIAPRYWQGNLFKQAPKDWEENYDIDARIPEKDLQTWQSQGPDMPLLRAALREMLEERCKLRLHLEKRHTEKVLELVVLKSKPKALRPFDPSEVIPSGARRFSPYPAELVPGPPPNAFYNTSMEALAYFLTGPDQKVFDATGLPGTYDFQLTRDPSTPETANDPGSPARMHVEDIGLGFRISSREMPLMIVDHYEKPSPN